MVTLIGGGCPSGTPQTTNDSNTITVSTTQAELIYEKRAASAARYMADKNFVAFIKSVQPSMCKGKTPNVSYIIEADLTGDGKNELVVDATSCLAPSSGSDMNLVAQVDASGNYSALKINGQTLVGYYTGLEVQNRLLVQESAVHNPGDAACCPSGGVDVTYLKWNGAEFVTEKTTHTASWLNPSQL